MLPFSRQPLLPTSPGSMYRHEAVCLLQIGLLIRLDHELVNHHEISIGHPIQRLQAEIRLELLVFYQVNTPRSLWHAVEALWVTWAPDIEVAAPEQVTVLVLREDGLQQLACPSLRP